MQQVDSTQIKTNAPLHIAVVGHTNTGKTSLMRTLTRQSLFGEVKNEPATTRTVEPVQIQFQEQASLVFYDTPGMEDGSRLRDYIEELVQQAQSTQRLDGPEQIELFLQSLESKRRFEQEAQVLKQLLQSDIGLYVIDVRDPVLGKHKDELHLLQLCGHPILPILNFTNQADAHVEQWHQALMRASLHVMVEFDTVAPPVHAETELYNKLGTLLVGDKAQQAHQCLTAIKHQKQQTREQAWGILADLLIDLAAFSQAYENDETVRAQAQQDFRRIVNQREQQAVKELLQTYRFQQSDFPTHALPIAEGETWGMDLFKANLLTQMGVQAGWGAAKGASVGLVVDLATGGASLGTGTVVGATLGGVWQWSQKWGKKLQHAIQGYEEVRVDDAVLRVVAMRQIQLVYALEMRGHAAYEPIEVIDGVIQVPQLSSVTEQSAAGKSATGKATEQVLAHRQPYEEAIQQWREQPLPSALNKSRSYTDWSHLSPEFQDSSQRRLAAQELQRTYFPRF